MNLSDYLKRERLTQAQFAERVGAHPVTVNRWATGAAVPKRRQMQEIERATAGEVTPNDMLSAAFSREARAGDAAASAQAEPAA